MSESVCGNRFNGFRWRTVLFISTVYRFELQLSYLTPELNDSAALISANLLLPTNKTVESVLRLASAVNPELKLGENEIDFCKSLFSLSADSVRELNRQLKLSGLYPFSSRETSDFLKRRKIGSPEYSTTRFFYI